MPRPKTTLRWPYQDLDLATEIPRTESRKRVLGRLHQHQICKRSCKPFRHSGTFGAFFTFSFPKDVSSSLTRTLPSWRFGNGAAIGYNEPGMDTYREFWDAPRNEVPVRGFLHQPAHSAGDFLILTHGAGTNCDSLLLVALANAFCASGLTVLRCDLPFRQLRPHRPPQRASAERSQQGLRAAIASMQRQISGRVFLGGHSYGGRQASMLAASEPGLVDQLLLLSYPLHPPRRHSEF